MPGPRDMRMLTTFGTRLRRSGEVESLGPPLQFGARIPSEVENKPLKTFPRLKGGIMSQTAEK